MKVSFSEMMRDAEEGNYAVGYFESWNLGSLLAVCDAAEKMRSPVIMGFGGLFLTSKRSNMPSEKMRITNNGKVGIGSDKPDTMLHIKSTEANAAITLERDDVEGESWELRSTFGGPHNYARFTIFNQNNDSDYLTILESGNVGIGVNEPKATLDIDGFVKMKPNSSEPVTCDEDHFGSMALTVKAQMCVCADNNQWELMNAGGALCNWEGKKETGEMCREDSECLNENCAFSYFSGFPQGFAVYTCQ